MCMFVYVCVFVYITDEFDNQFRMMMYEALLSVNDKVYIRFIRYCKDTELFVK